MIQQIIKISYLFPKDNKIRFWQDFSIWEGIPNDVEFSPIKISNGSVTFIGIGYGASKTNLYNLAHSYGNGAIYVSVEHFDGIQMAQIKEQIKKLI